MMDLLAWLLAMALGFSAGVSAGRDYEKDTELEQKVQAHMDVIVDEADAAKQRRETVESEFKESDCYKKAKEFVGDVKEISDDTKADIDAHFGSDETETETEEMNLSDLAIAEE